MKPGGMMTRAPAMLAADAAAFGRARLLHPRAQAGVELLKMVAVARQSPHRRAGVDCRPAEHAAVEGPCGLDIVGMQVC